VKQAVLELREINLEENYLGKCTLYRVHHVAKYLPPTWSRTSWVSVHCTEYTTWLNISSDLEENYLGKCTLYRVPRG
jgi:hypothetical protein